MMYLDAEYKTGAGKIDGKILMVKHPSMRLNGRLISGPVMEVTDNFDELWCHLCG